MVYKKRITRRPKRYIKRYARRSRVMTDKTKVVSIRRTTTLNEFTLSGAGTVALGYTFFLSQLPSYIEFTNLFQKFRIKYVVVKWYYGTNVYDADQSSIAEQTGFLHIAPDTNDAANPASVAEMQQYSGYRCVPLQKLQGYKVILHPTPSVEYYRSALTTSYGSASRRSWIDCTG